MMVKRRNISLYDIEEVLKVAGAERVHEKAIIGFETELEEMVRELVNEAQFYANYAGRRNLITNSDIELAENGGSARVRPIVYGHTKLERVRKRASDSRRRRVIEVRQI